MLLMESLDLGRKNRTRVAIPDGPPLESVSNLVLKKDVLTNVAEKVAGRKNNVRIDSNFIAIASF